MTGMRSWGLKGWAFLATGLVFAAGASTGFVASRFWLDPENRQEEIEPAPAPATGILVSVTNSRVYDHLGLKPEQRAQADKILGAHFERLKRLREERESIGERVVNDLLALLDESQREGMRQILRDLKISEGWEEVSWRLAYYKAELSLTPKQEDVVFPILANERLVRDEIIREMRGSRPKEEKKESSVSERKDEKPDREAMEKRRLATEQKLSELREARTQKFRAILTDDQFQRYQKLEEKRERERGRWGRGPRPGGGPKGGGGPLAGPKKETDGEQPPPKDDPPPQPKVP